MALGNNTLRQVVFPTISGSKVRIEISNEWGNAPLELKSVHVAKAGTAGAIEAATDKPLTFAGSATATVAAKATVMSDAVDFDLKALERVTISIAFGSVPADTALSGHPGSRTDSYIQTGDAVATADLTSATKTAHWYFITKLETETTDPAAGAIAILGDSITDGRGSTSAGNGLDQRWPDYLARKLQANPATKSVSVLNMGIGGNNVLSSGLGPPAKDRFARDILGQSGVKWLIVLEGINDIGGASTDLSQQLITAYQSFIDQAKAANIKAYGMTLLPFGNSDYAKGNAVRVTIFDTVNTWIRTSGKYDAVIDMDATLSDPANPKQLKSAYLFENDYLHLNATGYEAMGGAVDLTLFQ